MKSIARKELIFLIILFIFALGLRLIYLSQLQDNPMFDAPVMDARYHDQWAQAISNGQPFLEGPYFRAPLYPYFLAIIYSLFGHNYLIPRIVQFIIGSLSCVLIYFLGKRTFGPTVGKIAAVMAALYGTFIYFEGELLIPVVIIFLDLALILALLSTEERPGWWRWLGCGAILGLSAIARPNVLLFGAVLLPWLAVRLRRRGLSLRRSLVHLVGFCLGTCLVILPVTVRNYAVGKDFMPIASQGGVNFYIGNNPDSDGATAIVPGTLGSWWGGYWDAMELAQEAAGHPMRASEVSNYWFKKGLAFMRNEPGAYLVLMSSKLALFWGGAEVSNNKDIYFYSSRSAPLGILIRPGPLYWPFGILAPLALAGMVLAWRRREGRAGLMALFVFSYMVSVVLFFVTARYRLPVIPFLLPFAGYTLVRLSRERRPAGMVFPLGLILAFGLGVNLNLSGYRPPTLEDTHTRLGSVYLEKMMYDQAAAEFQRVLSSAPQPAPVTPERLYAITGLARVYQETGRVDEAIDLWKEAISLRPSMESSPFRIGLDMNVLYYQLGCAYYAGGKLDLAIAQWEETLRRWPETMEAYIKLSNAQEDKGQYREAVAVLEGAIEIHPEYTLAYFNLGNIYSKVGLIDRAAYYYQRAIEVDPNFADAYVNFAWLHAQLGLRLDEGIRLAKRALELDESNGDYWDTLAELYIKKGETEKAREIFQKMIQREPENPFWRRRLMELGG
jgi:pentatricopeptide repeat protein